MYIGNVTSVIPTDDILVTTQVATIIPHNYKQIIESLRTAEEWFVENEILNSERTNLVCPHTPFDSHLYTDKLDYALSEIKMHVCNYWHKTTNILNHDTLDYMNVMDCWIAEYGPGDVAKPHQHIPNDVICTFYYDVKDSAPLDLHTYDLDTGEPTHKRIIPVDGMLVLFHGNVVHSVPRCRDTRKVFASNWFYDRQKYLDTEHESRSFSQSKRKKDLTTMT